MLQRFSVALVLCCIFIQLLVIHPTESRPKKQKQAGRNQSLFNHYVFALTTKGGFCNTSRKCNRQSFRAAQWTIHGLWPSNSTSSGSVTSCAAREKFSVEKLSPIQERLNDDWPSFLGNNSKFWHHQWSKHGSCSVNHTLIKTVADYFNTTLDIYRKHNVSNFLINDNIVPRLEPYKTKDFFEAIRNDLDNKNVNVICRRAANISVVVEVRICLNETQLNVVDCPRKHSSCRKDLYYLPPLSPGGEPPAPADTAKVVATEN
ncbi:ribonuclease DdI [Galendromus occidentalis]|uniref:Ribonuclease DdI n=1 Tax=Galendromus occidentalis TaxID=34638 RepID=A0AAJ6VWE2_9ACAR|nr:ribonuclease DdI [Galendromus occidentalis]